MTRPTDQQQRDKALNTSRSWIVQAPAGSGKTELLTQRYLKLLGQVSRPERVLAVTFTRKASREMRQRILDRIVQALGGSDQPVEQHQKVAVELARLVLAQDEQLGWNLLQNPSRLRISTIDSLCAELAARQPLLAGNSWHLAVTENAWPMYGAAATQLLLNPGVAADGGQAERALERVLVFMEGKADQFCALLAAMLANRDQWATSETLGDTGAAKFAMGIAAVQQQLLDKAVTVLGAQNLQEVIECMGCIGSSSDENTNLAAVRLHELQIQETDGEDLILTHLACKALLTGANKIRKPGGLTRRNGFPVDNDDCIGAVSHLRAILESWQQNPEVVEVVENIGSNIPVLPGEGGLRLLNDLKLLLRNCLAYLNVEFDEQGRCDFHSVAEAAALALGSEEQPSDVLLSEDNRITHILMDEFQDTSRGQFALLEKLIAGWEKGDGRSLFLVGDPMQSIYGFREAEVGLFISIWDAGRLGTVTLDKLTLQNNFRSDVEIINWVNGCFPAIFPTTADAQMAAVGYTPFMPHKGRGGSVNVRLLGPDREQTAEAAEIARLIQSSCAANPEETIAVLARSKKLLTPIAHALLRLGVQFESVDADPLELRPVVLDLLSLCRALNHPLDRVAWISLLRAPWCALNLAEIHLLLGDDASIPVLERLDQLNIEAALEGESVARVRHFRNVIRHACSLRGIQPLSKSVEVSWLRLGGAAAVIEPAELDNANTFLKCLRDIEAEQVDDIIAEVRQRLKWLFARNSQHCNVQLMSIHKAKGLEFDRVIIPGADKRTGRGGDEPLVRWQRYPDGRVLMAPRNSWKFEGNSLFAYLKREQTLRERYETQRVLYVAVTRARSHLHIFGRVQSGKDGVKTPVRGSLLGLLWPMLNVDSDIGSQGAGETENEVQVYPLLRLKKLPTSALEPVQRPNTDELPDIDWHIPDPASIALGKALHLWLEIAHNNPAEDYSPAWIDLHAEAMTATLLACGAVKADIRVLLPELERALGHALGGRPGREIVLPGESGTSAAEWAVRVKKSSALQRFVIDRIELADGICTITDYKSGSSNREQRHKWREQLGRYAVLVGHLAGIRECSIQVYHPQDEKIYPVAETDN